MIRLYFVAVHVVLVIVVFLFYKQVHSADFTENYHRELLAFQLRIDNNLNEGYVIFIGDSHIQGLAVQEVGIPAVNYGIGSDTTEGVLGRLSLYQSVKKAKAVVLAIGFNDLKVRDDAAIVANIQKIIDLISTDTPTVISLLLPIGERVPSIPSVDNARIQALNQKLTQLGSRHPNVQLVNPGAKLQNSKGMLDERFHTGDGVHLNPLGYAVFIDITKHKLNEMGIYNK